MRGGHTTNLSGECDVIKGTTGKNEYIDWEPDHTKPTENKTINVGGSSTTSSGVSQKNKNLNEIDITNETVIIINKDDNSDSMDLGHIDNVSTDRVKSPSSSKDNPIKFGINLNGTDVYLTSKDSTKGGVSESSLIINLQKYTEMTLYNYDTVNESPNSATWAHMHETPYPGIFNTYYFSRRFESNVTMSGGKLNIVGNKSPSNTSNAGIIFKGPVATDSDNTFTLLTNDFRKQGAINFNSNGGTVIVDGNVTFDAAVGFSSWETNKTSNGDTYKSTITSNTNIDIEIKNGASINVQGDSQTDERYKDTAYGIHLLCEENETGTNCNGTINIILDNSKIITSDSISSDEAGIRIDNYKGNINVVIKNNSSITVSNGYGIHLNNCTGKINITVSDSTIKASTPLYISGTKSQSINLVGISAKYNMG